jgi:hypothetical protein
VEETQAAVPAAPASEAPPAGTAIEATAAAPSTDIASEPATPAGTDSSESTAAAEATAVESETPEAKSRRERQAEKRKQPTPPPPKAPTPEEIIAAYERQRQEREQTEAARRAEAERDAKYLGENKVKTDSGEEITRYEQLRREAFANIPDPGEYGMVTPEAYEAHKAALAKRDAAIREFNEYTGRRELVANRIEPIRSSAVQQARSEAMQWFGDRFEAGLAESGLDVQALIAPHLSKPDPMPAILADLKSAIERPHLHRIAELEDQHAADQSQIQSLTRQLGGEAAQPLRGGSVATGSQVYTRERLAQMMRSPEGLAEYRRNKAEIERQEAAGLIR